MNTITTGDHVKLKGCYMTSPPYGPVVGIVKGIYEDGRVLVEAKWDDDEHPEIEPYRVDSLEPYGQPRHH